jgi:membrane protease YdiL (CAAX protease family)
MTEAASKATRPRLALLGILLAVGVTAAMDAGGLVAFSALPLLPLALGLWLLARFPARELGLRWGSGGDHALAVLHPLAVMGTLVALAAGAGAIEWGAIDARKAAGRVALVAVSTLVVALLTEEGFFRGWLWGSLARSGRSPGRILVWTTLAFALWHVSAVAFPSELGYELPPARIPVFLGNVLCLGAVWGLLRARSGSILVASVGHGVWNGLAYILFGFGTKAGALGIEATALYGPEVGVLGLALNGLFAAMLWRRTPQVREPLAAAGDR